MGEYYNGTWVLYFCWSQTIQQKYLKPFQNLPKSTSGRHACVWSLI